MQRLYLFSRHVIFVVLQIQVTLDPLGVLNSQKVAVTLCIIYFVYFGLIILLSVLKDMVSSRSVFIQKFKAFLHEHHTPSHIRVSLRWILT